MDWNNLIADKTMILSTHYTPGRSDNIRGIALHHNAGNLSIEDCYNVWQSREASAHYQVQGNGLIGQLVNDGDTAWHAGNANPWTIGIEHANNNFGPWTISDATLESGAHLVAAICKYYGLGRPEWLVNVFPHSYFMATACPGEIAGSQNAAYMQRAQQWYDAMVSGTTPTDTCEQENDEMNALVVVNSGTTQVWVCNDQVHDLDNPDTAKSVMDMYSATHNGAQIPCFVFGEPAAPWFSRFVQACRNGIPNQDDMDIFPGRAENRCSGNKGEE